MDDSSVDGVFQGIGFGRWQLKYFLLTALVHWAQPPHLIGLTLLNPPIDFRCFSSAESPIDLPSDITNTDEDYYNNQCLPTTLALDSATFEQIQPIFNQPEPQSSDIPSLKDTKTIEPTGTEWSQNDGRPTSLESKSLMFDLESQSLGIEQPIIHPLDPTEEITPVYSILRVISNSVDHPTLLHTRSATSHDTSNYNLLESSPSSVFIDPARLVESPQPTTNLPNPFTPSVSNQSPIENAKMYPTSADSDAIPIHSQVDDEGSVVSSSPSLLLLQRLREAVRDTSKLSPSLTPLSPGVIQPSSKGAVPPRTAIHTSPDAADISAILSLSSASPSPGTQEVDIPGNQLPSPLAQVSTSSDSPPPLDLELPVRYPTGMPSCPFVEYNTSIYLDTIITSFHLVCERSGLKEWFQPAFICGFPFSGLVGGLAASRFGFRLVNMMASLALVVYILVMVVSPWIELVLLVRFLVGTLNFCIIPCSFNLALEVLPSGKVHNYSSILLGIFFSVGTMCMAGIGYGFRTWRYTMAISSLPLVFVFPIAWYLEDSPRWLIQKGRGERAASILTRAARQQRANLTPAQLAVLVKIKDDTLRSHTPSKEEEVCVEGEVEGLVVKGSVVEGEVERNGQVVEEQRNETEEAVQEGSEQVSEAVIEAREETGVTRNEGTRDQEPRNNDAEEIMEEKNLEEAINKEGENRTEVDEPLTEAETNDETPETNDAQDPANDEHRTTDDERSERCGEQVAGSSRDAEDIITNEGSAVRNNESSQVNEDSQGRDDDGIINDDDKLINESGPNDNGTANEDCNDKPREAKGSADPAETNSKQGLLLRSFYWVALSIPSNCKRPTLLTYLHLPGMRRILTVAPVLWFLQTLLYIGIILNANNFASDDSFLYMCTSGAMDMLAILLVTPLNNKVGRRVILPVSFFVSASFLVVDFVTPEAYYGWKWVAVMLALLSSSAAFQVAYVYQAELLPTVVRAEGTGYINFFMSLGFLLSSFVTGSMAQWAKWIPVATFIVCAVVSGVLATLLPETRNLPMPETVADVEARWRAEQGKACWKCPWFRSRKSAENNGVELAALDT